MKWQSICDVHVELSGAMWGEFPVYYPLMSFGSMELKSLVAVGLYGVRINVVSCIMCAICEVSQGQMDG